MRGVDNISSWIKKPNRSKRKSVFNKQKNSIRKERSAGYEKCGAFKCGTRKIRFKFI